jgi:hypothetical protein
MTDIIGEARNIVVYVSRCCLTRCHRIFLGKDLNRILHRPRGSINVLVIPSAAVKAVNQTVVIETAAFNEMKTQSFIKTMIANVIGKRIDQHGRYLSVRETAAEHELHDFCSIAPAEIIRFSDPDIYGTQSWGYVTPIAAFFARRIDDLNKADGTTIELSDQLLAPIGRAIEFNLPTPVIVRGCGDDVRLLIPMPQQR